MNNDVYLYTTPSELGDTVPRIRDYFGYEITEITEILLWPPLCRVKEINRYIMKAVI